MHDSDHEGVVRIFVAHSCELGGFFIYIALRGTIFPFQECNITRHNFSPTRSVTLLLQTSYSSYLHDPFTMVFAQQQQCTSPSLFYRFEVSRSGSNRSLKNVINYGFLFNAIFSFTCTHVLKSLSNEM